jgi:FkbM family methyltransferase
VPSTVVRLASRCVSWYLRSSPIQKGKHAIWRIAAKRFLVAEIKPGLWIRASGLTDAEKELFLRGSKEPRSVGILPELLEPYMVAFDVGANIGYYSLIVAGLVGEKGQVHAFEPTPALAERIRLNRALNGLTQIEVNQVAVAEATGTAFLHISLEDPEANSLFHMEAGTNQISVSTTTLDAYAADGGIDRIDFIKIDCEGSELNVLRGATRLLNTRDPIVLLECNSASLSACGATVSDLCLFLRDAAYECYCVEQLRAAPDPVWNLLALKQSHTKARLAVERVGLERFDLT